MSTPAHSVLAPLALAIAPETNKYKRRGKKKKKKKDSREIKTYWQQQPNPKRRYQQW